MQNVIEVKIKASDVKGSNYCSNTDCPLARALKRMFPEINNDVLFVGGVTVDIFDKVYNIVNHEVWTCIIVDKLQKLAENKKKVDYTVHLSLMN